MVAFHDRRNKKVASVDDVASRLSLNPGDTLGKDVINDRFAVRGTLTPEGKREFIIHEVLPNGQVIERGKADKRYMAKGEAAHLEPTSVYDI